jgi:hypothetical protein
LFPLQLSTRPVVFGNQPSSLPEQKRDKVREKKKKKKTSKRSEKYFLRLVFVFNLLEGFEYQIQLLLQWEWRWRKSSFRQL